jgi:hypothetical protein
MEPAHMVDGVVGLFQGLVMRVLFRRSHCCMVAYSSKHALLVRINGVDQAEAPLI